MDKLPVFTKRFNLKKKKSSRSLSNHPSHVAADTLSAKGMAQLSPKLCRVPVRTPSSENPIPGPSRHSGQFPRGCKNGQKLGLVSRSDLNSVASFPLVRARRRRQNVSLTWREFDLEFLSSTTDSSCFSDYEERLERRIDELKEQLKKEKKQNLSANMELRRLSKENEKSEHLKRCQKELSKLKDDYHQMEAKLQSMAVFKAKVLQLRQEKCNLAATYENNLQKFLANIGALETENIMLYQKMKKSEAQAQEKEKKMDEKLRRLEAENQALNKECSFLKKKVKELEEENRELSFLKRVHSLPQAFAEDIGTKAISHSCMTGSHYDSFQLMSRTNPVNKQVKCHTRERCASASSIPLRTTAPRESARETRMVPSCGSMMPNSQYFYSYSDEDSDSFLPASCNISTTSTVSLNEILDDGDDTDTLLSTDFTYDKCVSRQKSRRRHDVENSRTHHRGQPDIVRDIVEGEAILHGRKSPKTSRKRVGLSSHRKHSTSRPSSLILAPKEKHFIYQGYSSTSTSSLESSDGERERRSNPRKSQPSSKSSSLSPSGTSGSSRKNSLGEDLTPINTNAVSIATKSFPGASFDNVSPQVVNSGSLPRKKGPPPPVPVKPASGRRSPGIKMGTQVHRLRAGKPEEKATQGYKLAGDNQDSESLIYQAVEIQVFSQSDHVTTSTPIKVNHYQSPQNSDGPKCSISDSSIDSSKTDKVERSGSKDDGYSTMSSDIQPEAMEKFSDANLSGNAKGESPNQTASHNASPVCIAKLDSNAPHLHKQQQQHHQQQQNAKQYSPVSRISNNLNEFVCPKNIDQHCDINQTKNPSVKLSSSPDGVNHSVSSASLSDSRSVMCGSVGKVKAMAMMFEAETCKQSGDKYTKFPLRKSPSLDSKLCHNSSNLASRNLNRRSLDADFRMFPENHSSDSSETERCPENEGIPSNGQSENCNIVINNSIPGFEEEEEEGEMDVSMDNVDSHYQLHQQHHHHHHHPLFSAGESLSLVSPTALSLPMIPHASSVPLYQPVQMLNISEENFLSDIPEERDEFDVFYNSQEKILEESLNRLQSSQKYFAHLHLLQSFTVRNFWCSLEGLARDISEDGHMTTSVPDSDDVDINGEIVTSTSLERCASLSALDKVQTDLFTSVKVTANTKVKVIPCLVSKKLICFQQGNSHQDILHQDVCPDQCECDHDNHSISSDVNIFGPVLEPTIDFHSDQCSDMCTKEMSPFPEAEHNSKFNSDYYSLCRVGSNRSLFSTSNDGDNEAEEALRDGQVTPPHTCHEEATKDQPCPGCLRARNTQEFDEISKQLACLSKTVNALHPVLDGLHGDSSENESVGFIEAATVSQTPRELVGGAKDQDDYQWEEEEEYYLTSFADTSCNHEFEFYGKFPQMKLYRKEETPPSVGSVESLDDNIGVDQEMCSYLLCEEQKEKKKIQEDNHQIKASASPQLPPPPSRPLPPDPVPMQPSQNIHNNKLYSQGTHTNSTYMRVRMGTRLTSETKKKSLGEMNSQNPAGQNPLSQRGITHYNLQQSDVLPQHNMQMPQNMQNSNYASSSSVQQLPKAVHSVQQRERMQNVPNPDMTSHPHPQGLTKSTNIVQNSHTRSQHSVQAHCLPGNVQDHRPQHANYGQANNQMTCHVSEPNSHIYESIDYASVGKTSSKVSILNNNARYRKTSPSPTAVVNSGRNSLSPVPKHNLTCQETVQASVKPRSTPPVASPGASHRPISKSTEKLCKPELKVAGKVPKHETNNHNPVDRTDRKSPPSSAEKSPAATTTKMPRISFFRRKSTAEKKTEEKNAKASKKPATVKEPSKIPKAVKQEPVKNKKFLRSTSRSSTNSISSSTSSK